MHMAYQAAQEEADALYATAQAREAEADALHHQCASGRKAMQDMTPRLHTLSNAVKARGRTAKAAAAGDAGVAGEEAELKELSERFQRASAAVEAAAAALETLTGEMDEMWQAVDAAQHRAEGLHVDMLAAEVRFRKEKAEAEGARVMRDKEVAEAEEAEANARRERAEADAARAAARRAEEEAAQARARERAMKEDFERRVQEAARSLQDAEAAKLSQAAEAEMARQREARKERERMLKFLAAQEEKRLLEAEEQAAQRQGASGAFAELAARREAELALLRSSAAATDAVVAAAAEGPGTAPPPGLPRAGGEAAGAGGQETRFPWRRQRLSMEPGFSRQPRPALANDFVHVVRGWEGAAASDGGAGAEASGRKKRREKDAGVVLEGRVERAVAQLPPHVRPAAGGAALSLAKADYLQALKDWEDVGATGVLEGDVLKLSGRELADAARELLPVELLETGLCLSHDLTHETSVLGGGATPLSTSRIATPLTASAPATAASLARVPSHASRPASGALAGRAPSTPTSKNKYSGGDGGDGGAGGGSKVLLPHAASAPAFSRRPSTDLAAVNERLVLEDDT